LVSRFKGRKWVEGVRDYKAEEEYKSKVAAGKRTERHFE
jgi:hypothetical protein